MKVRVTQTDIARVAGVHNTTVSLALRNSRLIPDATRERIRAIAESLGYCPDPALRALVAYRNARRVRRRTETLAYVTNWETRWGWRNMPAHDLAYTAAQRRATELGYQIEHLWLGEAGMTQRRLDSMLVHRGICGVLLASHRSSCDQMLGLNWSRLSAVKIGCFPHVPVLNQVMADQAGAMRLALRQVGGAGYQRIGVVLDRRWDDLADQAWSSAFYVEQHRNAPKDPVPLLYLQDPSGEPPLNGAVPGWNDDASAFAHWYHTYKPDVIIGLAPAVLQQVKRLGLVVPRDVAYVDLFLQGFGHNLAGVRENCEKVGEVAVEMLATQLQQNLFGLPAVATVTLIGACWHRGDSLPDRLLSEIGDLDLAVVDTFGTNLVA